MAIAAPVTITCNGRDRLVIMSMEEYSRLKRRDRRVMRLEDFTEEDMDAIRKAKPRAKAAAFDHEVTD
jgi:PHD/YefM family antitoxin component YafN of YafNO toxin-antitoxin module